MLTDRITAADKLTRMLLQTSHKYLRLSGYFTLGTSQI